MHGHTRLHEPNEIREATLEGEHHSYSDQASFPFWNPNLDIKGYNLKLMKHKIWSYVGTL